MIKRYIALELMILIVARGSVSSLDNHEVIARNRTGSQEKN